MPDWHEGTASSIQIVGLKSILELNPMAEGVIMVLCDQPHVTSDLLNSLMVTYRQTGKIDCCLSLPEHVWSAGLLSQYNVPRSALVEWG